MTYQSSWTGSLGSGTTASTARYGCCPPGSFMSSSTSTSCSNCPTGTYGPVETDDTSCFRNCSTGKYSDQTGLTSDAQCKVCAAGQYQEEQGQALCNECDIGRYLSDPGSSILLHSFEYQCQICLGSSCKCARTLILQLLYSYIRYFMYTYTCAVVVILA